jgi:hypothetical protein
MGRPVKGVGSDGLGEYVWVMRSPRDGRCSTTVIRPTDYAMHYFWGRPRFIMLGVNNAVRYY